MATVELWAKKGSGSDGAERRGDMAAPVWMQAGAVAAGGAVGSLARWGMWRLFVGIGWDHWPLSTLAVNVLGCLSIGFVVHAFTSGTSPEGGGILRAAVLFGVLGGFTTFSALGLETFEWMREGRFAGAMAMVAANVVLGIGAVALGWWSARVVLA